MVLFYILFLIPLITATRRSDVPSYRSNVMEGDKPMLVMAPEADDEEDDNSGDKREPSLPAGTNDPAAKKDMKRVVNWLINNFSHDLVSTGSINNNGLREGDKPIVIDNSNEAEDSDPDHDEEVVVQKFGVTEAEPITESPAESSAENSEETTAKSPAANPVKTLVANKESGLRTHKNKKKHNDVKADPAWMTDLKDFIKDLTTRYGQQEVLEKTRPNIASLEKKHHMKIKDIDVDEYGEIHITYIEKEKGKKASRQSKHSDDS